jgi:hypothetical protein
LPKWQNLSNLIKLVLWQKKCSVNVYEAIDIFAKWRNFVPPDHPGSVAKNCSEKLFGRNREFINVDPDDFLSSSPSAAAAAAIVLPPKLSKLVVDALSFDSWTWGRVYNFVNMFFDFDLKLNNFVHLFSCTGDEVCLPPRKLRPVFKQIFEPMEKFVPREKFAPSQHWD